MKNAGTELHSRSICIRCIPCTELAAISALLPCRCMTVAQRSPTFGYLELTCSTSMLPFGYADPSLTGRSNHTVAILIHNYRTMCMMPQGWIRGRTTGFVKRYRIFLYPKSRIHIERKRNHLRD